MEINTEAFDSIYGQIIENLGDNFWIYGYWRFLITFEDGGTEINCFKGSYEDAEETLLYRVEEEIGEEDVRDVELMCNAIIPFAEHCADYGCVDNICSGNKNER